MGFSREHESGEIKENLTKHHPENNPITPPTPQETHYLHTTHTSCFLCGRETEGVAADVTVSLLTCWMQVP